MTSNWIVERVPTSDVNWITVKVSSTIDSKRSFSYDAALINGMVNSRFCYGARWEALNQRIKYRSTDVLILSYPKCGTTWSEQCVLLLQNGCRPDLLDPASKNTYTPRGKSIYGKLWPEAALDQAGSAQRIMGKEGASISWEEFDSAPSPRIIKSHASVDLLLGTGGSGLKGLPDGMKVLIVTRNPLDACVSCFHHAFNPAKEGWDFDAWAAVWASGNVSNGSWFEWVKSWSYQARLYPDKCMWIQYEDLQLNPMEMTARVADYLQFNVGANKAEFIAKVVQYASFDAMKTQAESDMNGQVVGHLRQGKSGDWKNYFSREMFADFIRRYEEAMTGTGCVYTLGNGIPITSDTTYDSVVS